MKIDIKQLDEKETELVVDLFDKYRIFYQQASDLVLAKKYIQARLNNHESIIFIAIVEHGDSKIPVGFTQLYPDYSSISAVKNWTLNDLYVEKDYRKMGIGELLIHEATHFAKANQAKKVTLSTGVTNATAQSLYEKIGFERQLPDTEYYTYTFAVPPNN